MIFTLCIYRIDMVGNSHPEKADEKIREGREPQKLQGKRAFHEEMEGSICLACQQEK